MDNLDSMMEQLHKINTTKLGVHAGKMENCPAFPICQLVGNAREGCMAGKYLPDFQPCIAGLILLTARGQGLYTTDMEEELQARFRERPIGFIHRGSSTEEDSKV